MVELENIPVSLSGCITSVWRERRYEAKIEGEGVVGVYPEKTAGDVRKTTATSEPNRTRLYGDEVTSTIISRD